MGRLSEAARRDGLRFVTQGGRPVFIHLCYDVKNGFNRKGQLAMAVWLAFTFVGPYLINPMSAMSLF